MPAPQALLDKIDQFHDDRRRLLPSYNETEVRVQYINPLFEALGWDVTNRAGRNEVKHEDRVDVRERDRLRAKAPDYGFYLDGRRRFFVEAKKPAVNLERDPGPALQLRRYAWTAKLPLSILTDFEELAIYDTRVRLRQDDTAAVARLRFWRYGDYAAAWDEIAALFGREAVLAGSLERFAEAEGGRKGIGARNVTSVDAEFLRQLDEWRDLLARAIANRNRPSQRDLNFAVQQVLDRIIFLRIAEDRGIEPYGQLQDVAQGPGTYQRLFQLWVRADARYNSGLFHFQHERAGDTPDLVTPGLTIDDRPLKDIIRALYPPLSPYAFEVFPADILGQVYEQFLGKVIRLTDGGHARVEEKPEVRKAGGVYYTPTYIVDYIVRQTVGRLLEGHTPDPKGPASRLRILDPACGSGSFLLGAYQYLLDWHLAGYLADAKKWSKGRAATLHARADGSYTLRLAERRRILLDNLYGVDIDTQAVEVTKLSLLLKVLEGTAEQLGPQAALLGERVLPDLDRNIKCGNSLIGPDFYHQPQPSLLADDELLRVNAFDWQTEFPDIMRAVGFDAVIGNPPYIRMETFKELKAYLKTHYASHGERSDIYAYFIEQSHNLLKAGGKFGMIVSNKFLRANYGRPLRQFVLEHANVKRIVDFAGLPVFVGATVRTIVLLTEKDAQRSLTTYSPPLSVKSFKTLAAGGLTVDEAAEEDSYEVDLAASGPEGWSFSRNETAHLLTKLQQYSTSLKKYTNNRILRGVISGLSEAFIIDDQTRAGILAENPNANEIIKPFVGGREIKRYSLESDGRWLIYTYHDVPISKYPAVQKHLRPYKEKLLKRATKQAWYELQQPQFAYSNYLAEPKIVFPDIAKSLRFTLDL